MDIFGKKKIKELTWDLMATKASLESKTKEYNELNNASKALEEDLNQYLSTVYLNKTVVVKNEGDQLRGVITSIKSNGGIITTTLAKGKDEFVFTSNYAGFANAISIIVKKKTTKKKTTNKE